MLKLKQKIEIYTKIYRIINSKELINNCRKIISLAIYEHFGLVIA